MASGGAHRYPLYKYNKDQGSSFHFLGNNRRVDIISSPTKERNKPKPKSKVTNGLPAATATTT